MLSNYYFCNSRSLGSVCPSKKHVHFIMKIFNTMFGSSQSTSSVYQKWPTPIRCKEDIDLSGALGRKTGKTLVLSGSSIIECGRGSGMPQCYSGLTQGLLNRWTSQLDLGCMTGGLERVVSVHKQYITLVPCKSLMHHDIQKIISYHNFYLFFPICK